MNNPHKPLDVVIGNADANAYRITIEGTKWVVVGCDEESIHIVDSSTPLSLLIELADYYQKNGHYYQVRRGLSIYAVSASRFDSHALFSSSENNLQYAKLLLTQTYPF